MKFEIKKSILSNSLKNINNLIDANNLNPNLSGVFIKARDNKLTLIATNGSSCYQQIISDVTIKEAGDILVKPKILYSYISKINQEMITINQIDEKILQIHSEKYSCEINLIDSSSFPILNFDHDNWKKITLTFDTLMSISQRIKPFTSSIFSNSNPATAGILFNPIDERQMECVASDPFRMAYYKFDFSGDSARFVIEPKVIDMALDIMTSNKSKTIDFYLNEKECILNSNDVIVKFTLYKDTYPNIIKAILSEQKYSFTVKLPDLINALDRGSAVLLNESRPIANFKIENNKLNIKFISNETGNSFEQVDLIKSNIDNFEVKLNQKLFSSIINTIKTETITFNFNSTNAPIVISSNNPYFLNLIVPIRSL